MKKYELARMQHKAHNWDVAVKWVLVPVMVMLAMVLCGWVDGPQ